MLKSILAATLLATAALTVASCGNDSDTIPVSQFSGRVSGASGFEANTTISANKVVNGQIANGVGDVFENASATGSGAFTFATLDYTGPIHFSTDGTPALSATLSAVPLNTTTPLSITPFTTVVSQAALAGGGLSAQNLTIAQNNVQAWLGNEIDVFNSQPVDPASSNANAASQAAKFYYLLNGGLGRLATEVTLTNAQITQALIDDASDGTLDGMDGNGAIAGIDATTFKGGLSACVIAFEMESSNLTIDMVDFNAFTTAIANHNGVFVATP